MDFIREDMKLYFDEDTRTEYEKFLDSITKKDVYGTYDEKKVMTVFLKNTLKQMMVENFFLKVPVIKE